MTEPVNVFKCISVGRIQEENNLTYVLTITEGNNATHVGMNASAVRGLVHQLAAALKTDGVEV